MIDVIEVVKKLPSFYSTYENWWKFYLLKAGLLPSPQILSIRNSPLDLWVSRSEAEIGRAFFHQGEYRFLDLDEYDLVVDVGAHVGLFTLLSADTGAQVHSYEPNPPFFGLLDDNIRLNGFSNQTQIFGEAVAGQDGTIELKTGDKWCPSIYGEERDPVEVGSVSLETVVQRVERLEQQNSLLKLDCEGAEFDILDSADREHLRFFDEILVEGHGWAGDLGRLEVALKSAGFILEIKEHGEHGGHEISVIHARRS